MQHPLFPCLGARSVFRRNNADVHIYDQLGSPDNSAQLLADLEAFIERTDPRGAFASFVAIFRGPTLGTEAAFETLLWRQLGLLHRQDPKPWSPQVATDPNDPHFAFSLGGTPFFIVGLHPASSRQARRAPTPTLVFNLHEQFEHLRASDRYTRLRDAIRGRDEALQGQINPMVDDHGQSSEARQYSGRQVSPHWVPPSS